MDYVTAILKAYPDIKREEFSLRDDGDGVYIERWSYSSPKPSLKDLAAEASKAARLNEIRNKRRSEYPTVEEQLDIIYHGGMDEWKRVIKAVKDKNPKD